MDGAGRPPGVGANPFQAVTVVDGAGELTITDRRVIALFTMGKSAVGKISEREGSILAVVTSHDLIEGVTVENLDVAG
jgi:proteasome assembly chaperone (PAC2) family protein